MVGRVITEDLADRGGDDTTLPRGDQPTRSNPPRSVSLEETRDDLEVTDPTRGRDDERDDRSTARSSGDGDRSWDERDRPGVHLGGDLQRGSLARR